MSALRGDIGQPAIGLPLAGMPSHSPRLDLAGPLGRHDRVNPRIIPQVGCVELLVDRSCVDANDIPVRKVVLS